MDNDQEKDFINKDDLINLVRWKCNYTFLDTKAMLNALIEVFAEAIEKRQIINVRGFGQLKYKTTPAHEGNKPTRGVKGSKERIQIPERESVKFLLSTDLRNIVKEEEEEI